MLLPPETRSLSVATGEEILPNILKIVVLSLCFLNPASLNWSLTSLSVSSDDPIDADGSVVESDEDAL